MRSTNVLERFNQEIKRRTRVVRIFPNPESCLRLIRALAVEQHEQWVNRKACRLDRIAADVQATTAGYDGPIKITTPTGYVDISGTVN